MSSFKSNENIHNKEDGSYYVVSANKASSVTFEPIFHQLIILSPSYAANCDRVLFVTPNFEPCRL